THRQGDDISVITWGAMVHTADEAAQQLDNDGASVEIVDQRTVLPWDKAAVLESVRKTSKVLVLHEDTRTCSFACEIARKLAEEGTNLGQIGGAAAGAPPQAEAPPEPARQAAAQQADAPSSAETPQPTQPQQPAPQAADSNGNRFVSPVVARIASEHNVDPAQVSGTGRGRRVTKQGLPAF